MTDMTDLTEIVQRARDELAAADDAVALDEVRVRYLGKSGLLTEDEIATILSVPDASGGKNL